MDFFFCGGRGEIRTRDTFQYDGFQDRCLKPLGHPSVRTKTSGKIIFRKVVVCRSVRYFSAVALDELCAAM